MSYTKIALLVFGLGLLLGLVAIVAEIRSLERVASGLMALGIAAIPITMIIDWRRAIRAVRGAPRRRAKISARRASPAPRRPRKSAPKR